MDKPIETGAFDRPDPVTKSRLFAEDKDRINELKGKLSRSERNNKFMAMAVVASVLVAGFGVWKAETKYYFVDRYPDGRKIIYVPDKVGIPANEVIEAELVEFIRNSRAIYRENRANLEMRWDALKMVQMSDADRKLLYNQAEKELKDLYERVSVMVTDSSAINVGGDQWRLEWTETYRDRRTGQQKSSRKISSLEAFYVEHSKDNPGGILFSKPIESSYSEQIEVDR